MNTPICDFVRDYTHKDTMRMHMPGHKGQPFLGFEQNDITEFAGADDLYHPTGIIHESEKNASDLFGCPTFYSTEGSSHCIRAMVYLATIHARHQNKKPCIAAVCNVHKAFLTAIIHLDVPVKWIYPEERYNYLSCKIPMSEFEKILSNDSITALYVTSPDYLGNTTDIKQLSQLCHKHKKLLIVDNAHGAYLHFLNKPSHPIDYGADLCCDSAHKTLPVITGGAYLHVNNDCILPYVKKALMLFGTTSPSYLTLQSLDAANVYLAKHNERLSAFIPYVDRLKKALKNYGWDIYGDEPLKITICPKAFGYTGVELGEILFNQNIVCEFFDPDFLVMMVTPETKQSDLILLEKVLLSIPRLSKITDTPPEVSPCEQIISPRQAVLSISETIKTDDAVGKILASPCVSCPPAVPIIMCGQRITNEVVSAFKYYGITHCDVLKQE